MTFCFTARRAGGLALALVAAVPLAGCSQMDPNDPYAATSASPASQAAPPTPVKSALSDPTPGAAVSAGNGSVTCSYPTFGSPVRPVSLPSATGVSATGTTTFTLHLNGQTVTFTSDRAATPCSTHSLASLARQGYYDGTACHRLVDAGPYLLQCGDPSGTGRGGPGYLSADELRGSETYPAGTVAMANTGQPNHNGGQFFIVYKDSDIPATYTVVGHLDPASLEAVQAVAAGGQDGSDANGGGKPTNPAQIDSVDVQE